MGALSLRRHWTWIPAGTLHGGQRPSGSRARTAAALAQGIPPVPAWREVWTRDVVWTRGTGLDVQKKRMTACRMVPDPLGHAGEGSAALKTCGMRPRDVLALADWLTEASRTHLAMERTGESWQPGDTRLADTLTVFLGMRPLSSTSRGVKPTRPMPAGHDSWDRPTRSGGDGGRDRDGDGAVGDGAAGPSHRRTGSSFDSTMLDALRR